MKINAINIYVSLLLSIFACSALASVESPKAMSEKSLVEPVKWEDDEIRHVRVVYNSDPSSKVDIIWKSPGGTVFSNLIYISEKDHGRNLGAYEIKRSADKITTYRGIRSAISEISDLKPSTKYYFIIFNDRTGHISKRHWFKTTSDKKTDPLYVVAGGDSRNNRLVRRKSNLLVKKLNVDAVFFGGDFTVRGWKGQWNNWLDDWSFTYGDDGKITPIVAARGNHEYNPASLVLLFNGPKGMYYDVGFNGGLLNLYVLNTEISMGGLQLEWLKESIKKTKDFDFNMALYHRSVRPHTSSKREGWQQYKFWAPLFYEHGMDLVVESDTHVMKVTWPLRPTLEEGHEEGFVVDHLKGVTYVGEGTWGAPLKPLNDSKSWTRASGSINQIKWLKITDSAMTVRTVLSENALEVGSVKDENRFKRPANLKVYDGNGGEIFLNKRKK